MNVVITGITGFAGSHLAEHLAQKGYRIRGLGAPHDALTNLDRLVSTGHLQPDDVILADLEDHAALQNLLDPRPDHVYHLAAQASVPRSWENPRETFRINVLGTLALLECLKELDPPPRMLFVGSADEYGASANGSSVGSLQAERSGLFPPTTVGGNKRGVSLRPKRTNPLLPRAVRCPHLTALPLNTHFCLTEDVPLQPTNPYSLSKTAADLLCHQMSRLSLRAKRSNLVAHTLPIIRVRAFNHIGPRQSNGFAAADFAYQIARGEVNPGCRIVRVGRLDAVRDLTDVRDMVRAYELAITKGEPGAVYNICSGKPRSLQELLDGILALSSTEFEIVQDPSLMRPTETPCVVGSNRLFRETTGWSPKIPWSKTLEDILEYQRYQVARESPQTVE